MNSADRLELDDDLIYQMTLITSQLFLKPMQVSWDANMFRVYNDNIPLYIKHEDLGEITHNGQCLNIAIIQIAYYVSMMCHYFLLFFKPFLHHFNY